MNIELWEQEMGMGNEGNKEWRMGDNRIMENELWECVGVGNVSAIPDMQKLYIRIV